jgi:chaperonin GroES
MAIASQTADEIEPATGPLTIQDILAADNLLDLLEEGEVTKIGTNCLEQFQYDLDSRDSKGTDGKSDAGSWESRYDRYLDIAMQVSKAKTFPWSGAANLKFPLLTTAAIQFQARAYPVIVDGSNLVKGRVLGDDPDGQSAPRPIGSAII